MLAATEPAGVLDPAHGATMMHGGRAVSSIQR
jgi:hypothetical protein